MLAPLSISDRIVTASPSITGAERVLQVLAALASHGDAMTAKDLLAVTGLAQSTLYRQIALLKRWGFVSENAGFYAPGPVSLQLALGFDVNSLLVEASREEMAQLARASHESIGLVVAVNDQLICLDMVDSDYSLRCSFEKGRAVPLSAGASAKCLLAFMADRPRTETLDRLFADDAVGRARLEAQLDAIRKDGFAISESEVDPGVWGVSAPLFRRAGRAMLCCAAITLMAPSTRAIGRESAFTAQTLRSARLITNRLHVE
ncbi:IclR family transcriptional regulator [Robbsia sp. KACC 23696]|uniref:IclR family transcriptional regulator n=1 Tax=Robbsia sp. KACC 23696 TaxID=3149231 RepID=UPI00325B1C90